MNNPQVVPIRKPEGQKQFRIGDLFKIETGSLVSSSKLKRGNTPRISVTSINNGVVGYYDLENEESARHFENFISVNFFGNVFYHPYKASVEMKVHVLTLKEQSFDGKTGLFFAACLKRSLARDFSYGEQLSSSKLKEKEFYVTLPVTKDEKIDFEYMKSYIAELEAERIAELEAYLKSSGLENTELTEEEIKVLKALNDGNVRLADKKIVEILEWQPQKEIDPLKIKYLTVEQGDFFPFYGQAVLNNGIISYERLNESVLNNINGLPTILIHSNNQGIVYLETPFYLKDGHGATSVLQSTKLNESVALFLMAQIKKVITQKFNYQEKATKRALKSTIVKVPVKDNGELNYEFMERYISAQKRLCIVDVLHWKDKQINATRQAIK